jgi:hypothetical protein
MTDKQSPASSQPSSSGADVEMKPEHSGPTGPDPSEIMETGAPVRQSQAGPSPQVSSRYQWLKLFFCAFDATAK